MKLILFTVILTLFGDLPCLAETATLGVSFEDIIEGLGEETTITESTRGHHVAVASPKGRHRISNPSWPGGMIPGSAIVEAAGDKSNVSEVSIVIGLSSTAVFSVVETSPRRLEVKESLDSIFYEIWTSTQRPQLRRFIKNCTGWSESVEWLDPSLKQIAADTVREIDAPRMRIIDEKMIMMTYDRLAKRLRVSITHL